ncbi:hypothetical protein HMPREF1977_0260 [Capnocytophaga ochracea F0287]|uniref:Uncharacterized protein n=1 Tax=Capnocytophaga ochracea F0287 TaxID=873517 RepID=E4MPF0_CAPOC|nr:hypothetical protein HMPREF1977_0260 [Capnocytophaga ochracea F0287]EJF43175.1 hypothetical protein HMPREF1319_2036 [Capnocytophaga ochracea str. Holt 25]
MVLLPLPYNNYFLFSSLLIPFSLLKPLWYKNKKVIGIITVS